MKIIFHKKFLKALKKLQKKDQQKVHSTLTIFKKDPHHPQLRNHPLKGSMHFHRSITVKGNLRIIFIEEDNYLVVTMIKIGGHDDVY